MAKKNTTESAIQWRLVHIIGNGTTRLETDVEKTVDSKSLTKLQSLIDLVFSKKPEDNNSSSDYHVITIAKDLFVRFISKNTEENYFSFDYKEIDEKLVLELIAEIQNIKED
jgi:hypothetical protein